MATYTKENAIENGFTSMDDSWPKIDGRYLVITESGRVEERVWFGWDFNLDADDKTDIIFFKSVD